MAFFLGSIYAETRLKSGLLSRDVQQAKGHLSGLNTSLIATGGAFVLAGKGLAGFAIDGITAAAEVEQAIANAASVTGLKSGPEFEKAVDNMTDVARKLGRDTALTAKEAADAMYDLASKGFDVAKVSVKEMTPFVSLAIGTQNDLAFTTEALTENLRSFGRGLESSEEFADVFATTIGRSAATLPKLRESLTFVGPVASAMGVDIQDVSAALGVLYNRGKQGATAGTALRNLFVQTLEPTKRFAEQLSKSGLSVKDVDIKTRGLLPVLQTLADAGFGDVNKAVAAFGKIHGGTLAQLVQKTKDGVTPAIDEYEALRGAIDDVAVSAEDMASTQLDTLEGAMENLNGTIEDLKIGLFGGLLDPLKEAISDTIVPFINGIIDNNSELLKMVGIVVAVGAPLLILLGALGLVAGVLPLLATGFGLLITGLLPLLAIAGAIAAVFFLIATNADALRQALQPVFEFINPILSQLYAIFRFAVKEFERFQSGGQTFMDMIKRIGLAFLTLFPPEVRQIILDIAGAIGNVATALKEGFIQAIEIAIPIVTDIIDQFAKFGREVAPYVIDAIGQIAGFISTWLPFILEIVTFVWNEVLRIAQEVWPGISELIGGVLGFLAELIGFFVENVLPTLLHIWDEILKIVEDNWPSIQNIISSAIDIIIGVINTLVQFINDWVIPIMHEILKVVEDVWPAVEAVIDGVIKTIRGIIEFFLAILEGRWEDAWEAILTVVSGIWDTILSVIKLAWEGITGFLANVFPMLVGAFLTLGGLILEAIGNVLGWIVERFVGFFGTVIEKIGEFAGQLAEGFAAAATAAGKGFANTLIGFVESAINFIIGAINSIKIKIPKISTPFGDFGGFGWDGMNIPKVKLPRLHSGGLVPGVSGQEVLAMLKAGERVLPEHASSQSQVIEKTVSNSFAGATFQLPNVKDPDGFSEWLSGLSGANLARGGGTIG